MRRTKIEHLSYSTHRYMCKCNVDEKNIVLVLLHWSFNRTEMFGSHTWGRGGGGGGGGGHYFNWRSHDYLGDFVEHAGYFTPIQGLLVFISFHVGLMKCMLSSFQLLP